MISPFPGRGEGLTFGQIFDVVAWSCLFLLISSPSLVTRLGLHEYKAVISLFTHFVSTEIPPTGYMSTLGLDFLN